MRYQQMPHNGLERFRMRRDAVRMDNRYENARVKQILGPPGHTRREWPQVMRKLGVYLGGWCHYYRHGESARMFAKLDHYVEERVARNLTRSQPTNAAAQPSSLIRAVNSETLSVGAYASMPAIFRKSFTACDALPALPPTPSTNKRPPFARTSARTVTAFSMD